MTSEAKGTEREALAGAGFHVGAWWVEPRAGQLVQGERVIRIEPKAMEVLAHLATRAGEVVSRQELERDVWRGALVGYDAVTNTIIKLRKALGDDPHDPAFIQTVPKRGYRLVARVETENPPAVTPIAAAGRVVRPRRLPARVLVAAGLILALGAVALGSLHWMDWHLGTGPYDPDDRSTVVIPRTGPRPPTIAVHLFEVLGADPDQLYLARGLTADLISDLSGLSGLEVMGAVEGLQIPGDGERVAEGARYEVWGGVQRVGDRIAAEVQLIDRRTGRRLWVERLDGPFTNLFEIQDAMSNRLAAALSVRLTEAERQRLAHRYTPSVAAYDLFLRGQAELLARTRAANERARSLYLRALERDPAFARAYAGLALTYAAEYRNQWGTDGTRALGRALELAWSALEIDPSLPEIHWTLAYVETQRRRHREALGHLDRALGLDRGYADALALKGGIHTYIGEPAATVPLVREAMRRNPGAGYLYYMILGRAYFFLGDWTQALINLREAASRNAGVLEVRVYLAGAFERAGDRDGAEWEADEIRVIDPDFSTRAWLATYPMTDTRQRDGLISALAPLGL